MFLIQFHMLIMETPVELCYTETVFVYENIAAVIVGAVYCVSEHMTRMPICFPRVAYKIKDELQRILYQLHL